MRVEDKAAVTAGLDGKGRRSVSLLMTRYFVLLQVPHAGGDEVRSVCIDHLPREAFIPNDLSPITPFEELVEDFGDLPMLAVVRNPWDWYVAWFESAMSSGVPAPNLWASVFDSGRADFRTALVRACTGEGYRSDALEDTMRRLDVDHYSALHRRIVGGGADSGHVEVARYEQLSEDFGRFLSEHAVPESKQLEDALRERLSAAGDTSYRAQYDDELRELVATRARRLIDEYGYEF